MQGRNAVPLERALLSMDLSRGLDERSRPEVGGDQTKLITALNNLIQEETGGWVKRHGLTELSDGTDDLSASMGTITRLLRLKEGLGAIGDNNFYHRQESASRPFFRKKNKVSEYSVTGRMVASTNIWDQAGLNGPGICCHASSTVYDIVAIAGAKSKTTYASVAALQVIVYEKASGMEVVKYDMWDTGLASGAAVPQIRMVFVDDRYLHVYLYNNALGVLSGFVHDSQTAWPASASSFTLTTIDAAGSRTISDIATSASRSFIVCGSTGVGRVSIASMNNSATAVTRTVADYFFTCDTDSNGLLWVAGTDNTGATGRLRVSAYTASDITLAATYNWVDPTITMTRPSMAVKTTGALLIYDAGTAMATFGATTTPSIVMYTTSVPADTSLTAYSSLFGWMPVSNPVRGHNDKFYIQVSKHDTNSLVSSNVLACVSDLVLTAVSQSGGGGLTTIKSFRPAVLFDPYNAVRSVLKPILTYSGAPNATVRQRLWRFGSDRLSGTIAFQPTSGVAAYAVMDMTYQDTSMYQSIQNFGSSAHMTAGLVQDYDGYIVTETGFVDMPGLSVQSAGMMGMGNVNGSVNYIAFYKRVDANGNATYSRMFGPVSITVVNDKVTITTNTCQVTGKETGISGDGQVTVEVYRTESGGTTYYRCLSSAFGLPTTVQSMQPPASTSFFYTGTDNISDATLRGNPILFRQPGVVNTPVDRFCPPPGNVLCQHKDRLFVSDQFGARVFYSSFYVDGEAAWFNPVFGFYVHGGSGPITGLASMDSRLFVFKKDAIFVVDGDGPPENGGSGQEFSPPSRLATEFGCVNPRSVVLTPSGIMYQSSRGIELLTRSLQVTWIGERVQSSVASFPTCRGAVLDTDSRVRFLMSDGSDTKELVYDTSGDCWSTATYDSNPISICMAELSDVEKVVVTDGTSVFHLDSTTSLDDGSFVPWTIETGHLRPSGPQGRFMLHDVMFLGKRRTNSAVKVSVSYDYEDYSQARKWEPASIKKTLVELNLRPKQTEPAAFRCKIEDIEPEDTTLYPLTTGKGQDLLNICFQVSQKAGVQNVASYQKG